MFEYPAVQKKAHALMYDMEELMDGGLFYIQDPHISVAEVAVHCYHLLWPPGFLSRLSTLFLGCEWVVNMLQDL